MIRTYQLPRILIGNQKLRMHFNKIEALVKINKVSWEAKYQLIIHNFMIIITINSNQVTLTTNTIRKDLSILLVLKERIILRNLMTIVKYNQEFN